MRRPIHRHREKQSGKPFTRQQIIELIRAIEELHASGVNYTKSIKFILGPTRHLSKYREICERARVHQNVKPGR